MTAEVIGIVKRIRKEISELYKIKDLALRRWEKTLRDEDYLGSVAFDLQGFYQGVERVFEIIAKSIDRSVTDGYLHWLDEDMANFLQELILEDLGFDTGNYFAERMKDSLFYPHFKKWGKERFVEFIADWNNANFKAPQFMKNFLGSLDMITIERRSIRDFN